MEEAQKFVNENSSSDKFDKSRTGQNAAKWMGGQSVAEIKLENQLEKQTNILQQILTHFTNGVPTGIPVNTTTPASRSSSSSASIVGDMSDGAETALSKEVITNTRSPAPTLSLTNGANAG
jgi:hypothetical protein